MKQYCFICSSLCNTNLVILVQATICQYYMCKVESFPMSIFYMTLISISKVLVFLNFVSIPTGTSPTDAPRRLTHRLHPTTIYTFMYNFIISYCAGLIFRYVKEQNILFNMIANIPWYVKYFRCETYLYCDFWEIM